MYVNPNIAKIMRVPQPEGRGKYLRLDQNENVDGVPKWLFDEATSKVTPEFLSIYPEEGVLTEKYAKLVGVGPENVSLTDGSVVGMGYIIKVFGEPGKKLLCVTPSFAMYKVYAEMIGMSIQEIEYEKDFSMDINNILDNNLGGYPVILDGSKDKVSVYFDESEFSLDEMRKVNAQSIYLDGIEKVENGVLTYTDELIAKAKKAFGVELPKNVAFDDIDRTAQFIIDEIITKNVQN